MLVIFRQFILEILVKLKYGNEDEFRLIEPDQVAELWGQRCNKPTMNREELSHALRYEGDIFSEADSQTFIYKFIYDLKQPVLFKI